MIDFSSINSVSKSAIYVSGFNIRLHYPLAADYQDTVYKNLAAMGFSTPEKGLPLFARSDSQPKQIFINPHGKTSGSYFQELFPHWIATIITLLDQGYEVVLNEGLPQDEKNSQRLVQLVNQARPNSQAFTSRHFADLASLKAFVARLGGVITLDTGLFHLVRHFGIPTIVITTPFSKFWVPEDELGFRSVPLKTFMQNPALGLDFLLEWMSSMAQSRIPDRITSRYSA